MGASSGDFLQADLILRKLRPEMEKAAGVIRSAAKGSRPLMLRYNNDADGMSAALAIRAALLRTAGEPRFMLEHINASAIYEQGDALADLSLISREFEGATPLFVLLDFGANQESCGALELLRKAGAQCVVIDHHPFSEAARGLCDSLVSPWCVEGGTSHYSAGLLAGEVAKLIAPVDVAGLQLVSLIGDKSTLIKRDAQPERLVKSAMVLDFLGSGRARVSLEQCAAALADQAKLDSLYRQALSKIADAREAAAKQVKMKRLENGFGIAVINLGKVMRRGEFPARGTIVGAMLEELSSKEQGPLVVLGYGDDAMSFRANAAAKAAGFNATRIIAELKSELPNAVDAGGGHDVAASIRANEGFMKIVLDEAMRKISQIPA